MGRTGTNAEREGMRQKYMFVAAMLLILTLASIGLTEAYIQYTQDGGNISTPHHPDAPDPGSPPADAPDTGSAGSENGQSGTGLSLIQI